MAFICLLAFLCISCTNSAKFEVSSKLVVDSIIISNGIDLLKLEEIKPGKSTIHDLTFSKSIKGDGNYQAEAWIKNVKLTSRFGYYSNGIPGGSKYIIIIDKDTIMVSEKF